MRDAGLGAEGDDRRPGLDCDRPALRARCCVDEGSGRGVDLVLAERERRAPLRDEVELLMPIPLEVLLDDRSPPFSAV